MGRKKQKNTTANKMTSSTNGDILSGSHDSQPMVSLFEVPPSLSPSSSFQLDKSMDFNLTNTYALYDGHIGDDDDAMADAIFWEHPEELLVPWANNKYFFPIIVTYVITFIIGVTGNLIVIWVMAGDRASRSVTSVFLVSLAVADLLLLTIYTPLEVAHYFVVQWDKDGTVCKLAAYAESVSAFASVLNLVAVTFERFVVIVFPIRSRSLCTMSNCKRLMVIVWILSVCLATPVIFVKDVIKSTFYNKTMTVTMFMCKDSSDWKSFFVSMYRLGTLFLIPSVLMIACYTWVIIELWISTKTMDELTQGTTARYPERTICAPIRRPESRASVSHESTVVHSPGHHRVILRSHGHSDTRDVKKARQQVIKMLILVVILFLVCWGPRLFMESIIKCCLAVFNHGTYSLRIVFYLLPFVHSCLNPIVYCFMSSKFRRRMLRCFERNCSLNCSSMNSKKTANHHLKASVSRANGALTSCSVYTLTSISPTAENQLAKNSQPSYHVTSMEF